MRFFSALFLIVLIGGVGYLTYENNYMTPISAWKWRGDVSLPLLVAGVYVLGMMSGWWLVGMMKRSWQRITERDRVAV